MKKFLDKIKLQEEKSIESAEIKQFLNSSKSMMPAEFTKPHDMGALCLQHVKFKKVTRSMEDVTSFVEEVTSHIDAL